MKGVRAPGGFVGLVRGCVDVVWMLSGVTGRHHGAFMRGYQGRGLGAVFALAREAGVVVWQGRTP